MGAWLGMERNQVLFSQATGRFYFVPVAQRLDKTSSTLRVSGEKIDVTSSVVPLVAHAVAGHLRRLATSGAFSIKGRRMLLRTAREVEKKADIGAAGYEE